MKPLLNTLYVTTQGAYLSKEGASLCVEIERQVRLRVPIHQLQGVVCFGNVLCSPFLLGHCAEHGVAVSFLTENGRFLAGVRGRVSGNVRLRREQHRRADDPVATAALARAFVVGKLANARTVLRRAGRDLEDPPPALEAAARRIGVLIAEARVGTDVDRIRGIEGDASRAYFGVFDHLITAAAPGFRFATRTRRPPMDPINALLSFLYVLMAHDCAGALEAVGLDPQVGFLHRDRPGRPSLALDLMEEFRPGWCDRLALTLVNRQQVRSADFRTTESGAVEMKDETRKAVVAAYQRRKQETIRHPYVRENVALGLLPHVQALLLARHLRGDLDGYPPYIGK